MARQLPIYLSYSEERRTLVSHDHADMSVQQAQWLLVLAAHLDTMKPEQFDMDVWYETIRQSEAAGCHTVGCAVGWACTLPELIDAGLHLRRSVTYGYTTPEYGRFHHGIDAAINFFGLNRVEAEWLFLPIYYDRAPTPCEVADRIRSVVQHHFPALVMEELL